MPIADNAEEKKEDPNEEVKEPEAKRAKTEEEPKQNQEQGLEHEIKEMQERNHKIFFTFDIGTPSAIFIKMVDHMRPHIDLKKIGLAIIDHVKETKEPILRFALRLIPVDILLKANKIEDFIEYTKPAIAKNFPVGLDAERITWSMEFKKRSNDKVKKQEFLEVLIKAIDIE